MSRMTQEAARWWRRLVRPIFLAMHRHGIGEIKIAKRGTKCVFELSPEGAGGGDLADGVDQGGVTAPKQTVRELMLALEFLRWACEHAEGKDKHEALHLQAAMSVGCRVLAKHGHLLEDFQREPYWQQVRSLPWTLGVVGQAGEEDGGAQGAVTTPKVIGSALVRHCNKCLAVSAVDLDATCANEKALRKRGQTVRIMDAAEVLGMKIERCKCLPSSQAQPREASG